MKTKFFPSGLRITTVLTALAVLLAALAPVGSAHAATCTVTTGADSGEGSLRALLADTTCTTINFNGDMTIHLASPLQADNVTIDGAGHHVVLSGDTHNDGRPDTRIMEVGGDIALNNLTLEMGFSNDHGSAIWNNHGLLTVNSSTFRDNVSESSSFAGAAIFNEEGKVEVANSTFYENSALWGSGSVIYHWWSDYSPAGVALSVTNSTFVGNTAGSDGAIASTNAPADTVVLNNNLFSNNRGGSCNWGIPFTGSNNVADDVSCGSTGFTLVSDTLLGTLGDYGGWTTTLPLLPGSPAIDAGNDDNCTATDQRGVTRPQGTYCDIGAYEAIGFTFSPALLPDGEVGAGYSQHISIASGNGTAPYAISVKEGSILPAGMIFDDHDDNLYGTPTQSGSFIIQFVAEDANGLRDYYDYTFNVVPPDSGYSISGHFFYDNNRNGILDGDEYATYFGETIQLDRGCDGTVDSSFRLIYYVQTYTFANLPEFESYCVSYYNPGYRTTTTRQVTSSLSGDMTGVNVGAAYVYLDVEADPPLSGPVNVAYQRTLTVSGGDAPYTFGQTDQALPPGLTAAYNADGTIVISGTPTQIGEYTFVVEAWDANGGHTEQMQMVWIQTDATATLTSSQNPIEEGQPVTFSLEFVPDYPFFGLVTFFDGDTPIMECENLYLMEGDPGGGYVDYNPATCTTAFFGGTHEIRAEYTAYYGGYKGNTYTIEQVVSAPAPILTGLEPASAPAGLDDVSLTITGSNFTTNSVVRWGTLDLETTFVSDTQLSVVIPASMQAVYTAQVTVYTPGGGTSNVLAFFFTWGPAGVISQDVASGTDPSASSGPATASATGEGLLVVAQYDANPAGTPSFIASGDYFDVYAAPGNTFSQVTIVACNLHGGDKLYWWDPEQIQWIKTSPQNYNPATGCVTLIVDASSVPSLSWFQGTVFAAGTDLVQYQSTGFTAPVDLGGVLNAAKAGQMLPLKWRLLDASGNPVLNLDPATVTMSISPYACPSGAVTDAIETYATGTSTLQNLGDGYYQLNWKTEKTYANSCRKLTLKIGDGSGDGFTALFQFKK